VLEVTPRRSLRMRMVRWLALMASLLVASCQGQSAATENHAPSTDALPSNPEAPRTGALPDGSAPTTAAPGSSIPEGPNVPSAAPKLLNFVAHQDDDFFLMSPDLFNVIRAGRATVASVVFTAGENLAESCDEYVTAREVGQMRAWEVMAGVDSPPPARMYAC
jgi:hypothetical protein